MSQGSFDGRQDPRAGVAVELFAST
jgi:hypothetical protein